MPQYTRYQAAWVDFPSTSTLVMAAFLNGVENQLVDSLTKTPAATADNTITGTTASLAINGGTFVNSFDTALWVAPATRTNPVVDSQGLYVQHRIAGDLGGLVHDAVASELRMNGATNGGSGQNAHEASLVVTGGANTIASTNGLIANFHSEGAPSGTVTSLALLRASAVPALTGTLTVGTIYGAYIERQTIGSTNYSVYAPDGDSVFGQIVPKTTSVSGLVVRGLSGQSSSTPLMVVQNSTPTNLFSFFANGTAGLGGSVGGNVSFWVNNNLATTSTVAQVVRAKASQAVDLMQWQDSTPTTHMAISSGGLLRWEAAADQQTTVGAAGGASALPATPTKYLKVVDSAGTTLVVPAYAAS